MGTSLAMTTALLSVCEAIHIPASASAGTEFTTELRFMLSRPSAICCSSPVIIRPIAATPTRSCETRIGVIRRAPCRWEKHCSQRKVRANQAELAHAINAATIAEINHVRNEISHCRPPRSMCRPIPDPCVQYQAPIASTTDAGSHAAPSKPVLFLAKKTDRSHATPQVEAGQRCYW